MRLRYNIYIIVFSILILSTNNLHAINYYVNDNSTNNDKFCFAEGNAANDGLSPFTPMDSIKDILADHDLEGGDTIYIDTGSYNEGQIDFPSDDSGSAALGFVTIMGAGAGIYGSGTGTTDISGYFVLSSSVQYLQVSHIQIYSGGANNFDINGADHIIISDNDFYEGDNTIVNQGSGTSTDVVITRNISHDSLDCFELRDMWDVKVIRNIMFNVEDNGVTFWDSTNVENRNNTIYNITKLEPIEFVRMGGFVLVINNLMQKNVRNRAIFEKNLPDTPDSVYTFRNNLAWEILNNGFFEDQSTGRSVDDVNSVDGWTNNIYEDPYLVDPANGDFNLQSISPCIDAGDPDYNYEVADGRIDIGAIEYQGIHHFELIHDGLAAPNYWEKVTIRALDFAGNVTSNFAGIITLWVEGVGGPEGGEIDWMNLSGVNDSSFLDFGAGDDRAVYEFVPADNGVIEVFIRDNTKESIDVEIFSPFFFGGVYDTDIAPKWLFVTANVPQILNHFEIFHDQSAELDQWERVLIFAKNAENFTIRSNIGTVTIDVGAVSGIIDWENVNTGGTILDSTSIIHTFPDGESGVLTLFIRDDSQESVFITANSGAITSNVTPGWLYFMGLDRFVVSHDGFAVRDRWETVRITAMTVFDMPYVDYTGTITISVIPDGAGMVEWRLVTLLCGDLTDLGDGTAEYTFEQGCNGGIVDIEIRVTNFKTCAPVFFDIEVISGAITDDDTEEPLSTYNGKLYYVNDNSRNGDMYCNIEGDDANNGLTPDFPKATIESLLGVSAVLPLEPGDIVFIDTGTYNENVIFDQPGGNAGAYIIITGSTQGSGTIWNGGNNTCLEIEKVSFCEIKNIHFENASGNDRECIDLQESCGNLRFYNNTFSESYRGIWDGTGVVNSIFYGNKFFNIDREGMRLQSAGADNLTICRNLFYSCGYNALHSMDPDNSKYVQNLFYNNSGSGGVANVDFETDSDFITFKYNTTAKAQNNNEGVKWFDVSAEVSYSIAYKNTDDGFDGAGDIITYCNSYSNAGGEWANCVQGVGCTTDDPLFVDEANHDYRLMCNSPLQGAGAGGQSIGRYTTKITPGNTMPNSNTYYRILFVTTPACSIPSDATIYVEFPGGFNTGGVTGASSPGMTHNFSASGSGNIVEVQLSGGIPKAGGGVEIVIISNVVNPAASSSNYYIRYWITDACGDYIEWPDDSNMFQISGVILGDLDVSTFSRISYNTTAVSSLLPGYTVIYSNWYSNTAAAPVSDAIVRNGIPSHLEYAGPANTVGGFVPSFAIEDFPPDQSYSSTDYDDLESTSIRWVRWRNPSLPAGAGGSETEGLIFSCYFTNTTLAAGSLITNISTAIGISSPISNSRNIITVGTLYGGRLSQADDLTNYTGLATTWTMFLTNKGNIETVYTLLDNAIGAGNSQIADWSISFSHASLTIPIGNVASFTLSVTPLTVLTNGAWIDFDIIADTGSPQTNYIGDDGRAYGGDIGKTNNGINWPGMEGKIVQQNNTTDGFPIRLWRIWPPVVLSLSKSISNVTLGGLPIAGPVPGSTVTYSIYYSNAGGEAQNMIIYDQLPANAIYFSNTPWSNWGAQYTYEDPPVSQAWGSGNYINMPPPVSSNVRWIRWTKSSVAYSETGWMIYSVIIK